jgi:YegS/Rv2252/BmrU family lipid kinase
MPESTTVYRPIRAKLIFNAISGRPGESPNQLAEILTEMQRWNILPEVYMIQPDSRIEDVVRAAIKSGIKLIVVAGGDGTIDTVIGTILGSRATLGVIPTGTRNNVAFNLGIPTSIPEAVALLREGRRIKVDVGQIRSGKEGHGFLEAATLGLISDLYPAADDLQHGDLAQIGTLLSTFVASTPSQLRITLDGFKKVELSAYMVLIANMPFIGPRFQIAPNISWNDGRLDVFVFSDMTKLDLISYAMQGSDGSYDDARIKHYRAKHLKIHSEPSMPVMANGFPLPAAPVKIEIKAHALSVMAGAPEAAMGDKTAPPILLEEAILND